VLSIVLERLRIASSGREMIIAYAGDDGRLLLKQGWLEQFHCIPGLRLLRKPLCLKSVA
jgi:hypothetical protein